MKKTTRSEIESYVAQLTTESIYELQREVLRFSELTVEEFLIVKITENSSAATVVAVDLFERALGFRSNRKSQRPNKLQSIELIADLADAVL